MNVAIYYGGRGLIDDPTLYVIGKIQNVLEELRVNVTRYNLHELKNDIMTLPQTLKEADGIILATTVEWIGIGGYMQLFLDACWLYGDKSKISNRHNISPIEVKSGKNYTLSSLNKFIAKYKEQLYIPYVLHTGDLKEENGIVYLPIYMTALL